MIYQQNPQQQPTNPFNMNPLNMNLLNNDPSKFYYFEGSALSLQTRLESMPDEDLNKFIDATITVTGVQIKEYNSASMCCTITWGSLLVLPLFLMCCDPWRKCTYAAYEIPTAVYVSLRRLFKGQNLRNLSLTVTDNCFDLGKAQILYGMISESNIKGFTFINLAGSYNFNDHEYSSFHEHMRQVKSLTRVISDIRWANNSF